MSGELLDSCINEASIKVVLATFFVGTSRTSSRNAYERMRENENQRETNELRLSCCCGLTQYVNQALVPNTLESLGATTSLR